MHKLTIVVDHLNDFGDGKAYPQGSIDKKIFIPFVLTGEEIEAEITKEKKDFYCAKLSNIISPSPERTTPPCKYYTNCGGCNLQHLNQASYLKFKKQQLENIIARGDRKIADPELFIINAGNRQRCNFKVKNNQLGFFKHSSHEVIGIDECKALDERLNMIIILLNKILTKIAKDKIFEIILTKADNGIDCVLSIRDQLTLNEKNIITDLIKNSEIIRMSYKINDFIDILYLKHTPHVTIAEYQINLPVNSFMQVSQESMKIMASLITEHASGYHNIVDLFAGFGSYGYLLCKEADITSYEADPQMVRTINESAKQYQLNIKAFSRDLFKKPLKKEELSGFDLAIINPPRGGAAKQIANFQSTNIIMISCNPLSFAKDAKILQDKGYIMQKIYGIDQFHWTNHLEIVAFFKSPH